MRVIPSTWTLERIFLIGTFVVSSAAFIFGVGVNWARVTSTDARVDAVERTYVRMDVYASDQRRLTESIDRLNITLDRIEFRAVAPTIRDVSPAPFDLDRRYPRRFDR